MGWELWGFFGVEGLDMRICWGFCGDYFRVLDRWRDQGREDIKGGLDTARVNACPSGDRGTRNGPGLQPPAPCERTSAEAENRQRREQR